MIHENQSDISDQQPDEEPDRKAQPVDDEQPPRLPFPVVGIGASAGGLEAVSEFLDVLRPDAGLAFVLVQHLPPDRESPLAEILGRRTKMPVQQVEDGMTVEPNHVYVIRPGHVVTIREGVLRLGPELGTSRAANRPVDDFFRSLAEEQRERAIAVILSGMGSNGTAGAQAVKAVGGLCIAQDPESAAFPSMPRHLIDAGYADYICRPSDLPEILLTYAGSPYAQGGREADARAILEKEQQHVREILAILRMRSRQDFTGYKKATVLRRVQRRMSMSRLHKLGEYAKLLRQSPSEVTALADDLLIHVTGFFRDPDVWETLHQRVIVPLVAARERGAPVRAWVTACSSGEEAYSLAMLLVEESDLASKRLDIKVFATDLAERTLAHARAGVYPGGIESELSAERLRRFFAKEDEVYRVRQELRDRVVFAPQNILQDPPFSRLDIASCRNLLIYLEPDVQHRVLSLLHFGLREGGTLFLGTSETVAGTEEMFETIDKKARLFRRVGPTRHGTVDFPLPRAISYEGRTMEVSLHKKAPTQRQPTDRPALAELTRRTLLDYHTPPAVTVDRDQRVVYYHGDTRPFLQQQSGEPTRDILLLAREGIRAAVRVALHKSLRHSEKATVHDGWAEIEPGRLIRVSVSVSPLGDPVSGEEEDAFDFHVISFENRGEILPPVFAALEHTSEEKGIEIRRLRSELQSTIEELQTSNEELKASNEEVMSVNEELQSSNEELETSKEEMQSLNEELRTVNSQLRSTVEEHLAASNDLASLLASTNIAVLFLDPSFRIRRYTPAIRELVDLISGDVGRPLTALAFRFEDPALEDDARSVLEKLVPAEREIAAANGRQYIRRIHPYRTADNRIDGVVITFIDITERVRAEQALRASEDRFRRMLSVDVIGVLVFDEGGTLIDSSESFLKMTGYTREQINARALTWRAMTPPEHIEASERQLVQIAATGRLGPYEKELYRRDGSRFWMLFAGASLGDGAIVEYCIDVSDRKRAEAALLRSEERLRLALAAARMGIWTLDFSTQTHLRDGNLNRLLGLPAEETTQPFAEFLGRIHVEDRSAVQSAFMVAASERRPLNVEFRVVHPDGSVRWLRDQGDVLGGEQDRRYLVGACVDVTERREAEAALRTSEERLRLIVSRATDFAIFTLDGDRRVTSWSPGAIAVFRYEELEILGMSADILFTPEDRVHHQPEAEISQALKTGRAEDERWHLRKDGSRFFASGVLTKLGGGAGGFVKVLRDLTERKRLEDALRSSRDELETRVVERTAELRASQDRSLRAERLAAIGQTVTTLAHEGRNALQRAIACLAMLGWKLEGKNEEMDLADRILKALTDLERLFEDLRDYAAPIKLDVSSCNVQAIWKESWNRSATLHADKDAELIEDLKTANLTCQADAFRMAQIFTNLFENAFDACENPVRVTMICRETTYREKAALCVSVSDNGPGFTDDQRERALEPFFSTKPKGTGLGLAIVRRLAEAHGGTLTIEDTAGKGATITLILPR